MLIIRDIRDDSPLLYSFYLNRNGTTIGVWSRGKIQYHHYYIAIDFNHPNRRESSELEFLILVGYTAEEMFELGMRAEVGNTMEVGKSKYVGKGL